MIDQLPRIRRQCFEIAHDNCKLTQGPWVSEAHCSDCHVSNRTLDRRLRYDADTHIALHEAADRVKAAQLHAQAKGPAGTAGLVSEKPLNGAGAVKPDHVVVQHLGKTDVA